MQRWTRRAPTRGRSQRGPAAGSGGALGEMLCAPSRSHRQRCAGPRPASRAAASLGGLWHNHGNCQVINRRVSMSWRQNAQTERAGRQAALLPSRVCTAPAQDAAPGHAACGCCCVSPASTKTGSVSPVVAGMSPCHPAARVACGSPCPPGRAGLCTSPCTGRVPACGAGAGRSLQCRVGPKTFFGEKLRKVLAVEGACESDVLMQKVLPLG